MNLLTINTYDCSAEASGGINRMTALLTHVFEQRGIQCYFGYFLPIDTKFKPTPFHDRIKLTIPFDEAEFETFICSRRIDIIQMNYVRKEFLIEGITAISNIAKRHHVPLIYAFHMCPGFQILTNGTWSRLVYGYTHHDQPLKQTLYFLLASTQKLWKPLANLLLRKKYNIPYQASDITLVLSKHYIQPYLSLCGKKNTGKITYIPNSLRYADFATEQNILAKEKTVIVVARFDEHTKRLSYVLRCWQQVEKNSNMQDWKLQFVGDGQDRAYYEHLVQQLHLKRVEFTGLQNPHDYYLKASIFCMTSTAEGWPMVLMEATQLGLPVVVMDSYGAVHDIIQDGYNGRIVKNNDLNAFTNALIDLMQDDRKRQTMSRNAVESSHRFEIDNVVKQWLKLFKQLLDNQPE